MWKLYSEHSSYVKYVPCVNINSTTLYGMYKIYCIVQLWYSSMGNQECCFLNINGSFNKRKTLAMYNGHLMLKSCLK